jgi:hypothetical protein
MPRPSKDLIQSILNNTSNLQFFKASSYHEDQSYEIRVKDGKKFFAVLRKGGGGCLYRLDYSTIGAAIELIEK